MKHFNGKNDRTKAINAAGVLRKEAKSSTYQKWRFDEIRYGRIPATKSAFRNHVHAGRQVTVKDDKGKIVGMKTDYSISQKQAISL